MASSVFVHSKDARAVAHGHPWVYRQAVAERPRALRSGAEVEVASSGRPFLARGIWDPESSIAVRVWTREPDVRIDAALLGERIRAAAALREAAGVTARTDAYRLVNAEGDRMPGVLVDRYGDWLTVTLQSDSLDPWLDRILAALRAHVDARGVYLQGSDESRLLAGERCPAEFEIREPAGRFLVSPAAPGKTGLFTDMREARALLAPLCRGKRFLNLFAHTGAFSGAAAAAGAASIVSVDLSARYLAVASRNVGLNAAGASVEHETVAADAFDVLRRFAGDGRRFDVLVCDPPTFSSSKSSGAFSVKDQYRPLVRASLRVLEAGGLAAFATNFRGLDRDQFLRLIHDAAELDRVDVRVLTVLGPPADHPVDPALPEGGHLHFALCARADAPPAAP